MAGNRPDPELSRHSGEWTHIALAQLMSRPGQRQQLPYELRNCRIPENSGALLLQL